MQPTLYHEMYVFLKNELWLKQKQVFAAPNTVQKNFPQSFDPQNGTFNILLFKIVCSDFNLAHLLDQIGCKLIFFVGGCVYRILNKRIYPISRKQFARDDSDF